MLSGKIGKRFMGEIVFADRLRQLARARSPHAQATAAGGNIIDIDRAISGRVAANPGQVMDAKSGTRYDLEAVIGQACDGEVALDAPARIWHLRIGDGSYRLVHLVASDTL